MNECACMMDVMRTRQGSEGGENNTIAFQNRIRQRTNISKGIRHHPSIEKQSRKGAREETIIK
jgi:hypothetical protein